MQVNQKRKNPNGYDIEAPKLFVLGVDENVGEEGMVKGLRKFGDVVNVYGIGYKHMKDYDKDNAPKDFGEYSRVPLGLFGG